MAKLKPFTPITAQQIAAKGVAALGDRPNTRQQYGAGGLSAIELKLWFDQLATLIAARVTEIQKALHEGDGDYISLNADADIVTLSDLTSAIFNGKLAAKLKVGTAFGIAGASLDSMINKIEKTVSVNSEDIEKNISDIRISLDTTKRTLTLTLLNKDGTTLDTLDIDLTTTTERIADGAVTMPKIAHKSLSTDAFADQSISTRTLQPNAVTEDKLSLELLLKLANLKNGAVNGVRYDAASNKIIITNAAGDTFEAELNIDGANIGADPIGTAQNKVAEHNADTSAHADIRALIAGLSQRLSAIADSDDNTLDQLSEIVAFIKSNKNLIDNITTAKINYSDIVNDLVTNDAKKPLSAAQGVAIKKLIDELDKNKVGANELAAELNRVLEEAKESGEFDGESISISEVEESAESGGISVITFSDGTKMQVRNGFTPYIGDNGNWFIGNVDTTILARGKDGTSVTVSSVTESTESGGTNVVQFSDGNKLSVQNGNDYVLTEADKQEIAEMIDGATIVQAPTFVDSVDKMTDTSKPYVNTETGTIWVYRTTTHEKEVTVTDNIVGTDDNPYEAGRFSGDGSINTDASTTHVVTPYIDFSKYEGKTIELHLDGNRYVSETAESFIMHSIWDSEKKVIYGRLSTISGSSYLGVWNELVSVVIHSTTSATITITPPMHYGSGSIAFRYARFCGLGSEETSNVYITYQGTQTVTEGTWVDTGVSYGGSGVDEETLAKISAINNEGASPSTIKLLPKPVLDFYNAEAYSDGDYSYSHLSAKTYPCRTDIPVPFLVKWEHNENAMRTTVAVDNTKAIGTLNRFTMRTYDATGRDMFPIYNLLPNHTYYYKVTHIMADGSLVEAKSGSFTTDSETIRLIYIDGTQNVRDLGGWTGMDGKKVKYGQIFRGAALSDSSYPELIITGKGKRALGDLDVQAELSLGAVDTETSIAANCAYTKIGYSNYATAITDETYRGHFKTALEWIVTQLTASKPIYMHCQGGCDRTGTIAFQLLGLLGVSESDLAKEYELSSFSDIGLGRYRSSETYDYSGMVAALKAYSGDTIADKFYDFATTGCGISADTIARFRSQMLE